MRVVLSMIFSFMMFFTLNCKELSYNKIQPHPRLLMKRGEEKKIIKQLDNGKNIWLNLHYSKDRKRIVIHTWQASGICRQGINNIQPFLNYLSDLHLML